ncbi:TetR/AcrR family transcriptional regulator [Faecalicatena orotica]|uniref:TetR family transcriptional regulator n=1 Tax=Faecalicatena orotica TaxID=1544 RepID=A0A2Y9C4H8_9FIRM|nr:MULTISPECIES: TetR/AcrR family transcriptional regulator [Clostridia]PWJ31270.1 TetR family transcriptional regulator [Faecalicatena orotica]SSA54476.1 transcriptional regulator, TetR family [Faecalicatena orotica]
MPKIVSEEERGLVKDAMYDATIGLIRKKGVRKVTVDDITEAVGISKGAFYMYYPSKEVCIYEVLKQNEKALFARMEEIMQQDLRDRERCAALIREVMLSQDSLILFLSPADLEILLRKLPAEYREREAKKSDDYFKRSLELLKVGNDKMEAVAMLTDCLSVVASNEMFSERGKQEALDVLVMAMADYISKEESV